MSLFGALQVFVGSDTDDLTHLVSGGVDIILLHLQLNEFAGKYYFAKVITRVGFHHDFHTFLQRKMRGIMEITLTRILELHLDEIGQLGILREVREPVAHGQHVRGIALGGSCAEFVRCLIFLIRHICMDIYGFFFLIRMIICRQRSKKIIFAFPFCSI